MNEAVSLEGQPSEPRSIIEAFDPSTGALGGDTGGPFWKAIERAHELGFRGGGHRVAIIDTMCDLSMPYLKSRVDRVWSDGECDDLSTAPLEHGTAVALLISLIAPEARLDVYPAVASKFPQTDRVIRAISAAAHSEAPGVAEPG